MGDSSKGWEPTLQRSLSEKAAGRLQVLLQGTRCPSPDQRRSLPEPSVSLAGGTADSTYFPCAIVNAGKERDDDDSDFRPWNTGVRAADYESTFTLIARKLQQSTGRTDLHLARCLWGEQLGSQLHKQGASIPLYDTTRSVEEVGSTEVPDADADAERMLWGLLYQDPLYELRLLALRAGAATDTPPR